MVLAESHGTEKLRTQLYDGIVKGFALASYKFKQAVNISPTSAWRNFFYREDPDALTSPSGNSIKGIPRGAAFPQKSVTFERVEAVIEKYGLEDNIAWEDLVSDEVDVRNRTLLRIAEGVAKSVDDEIWDVLTESQSVTDIQSVTITHGWEWNTASAAIFDDLGAAKRLIATKNYPLGDLLCFISPQGQEDLDNYIFSKGAQAPQLGNSTAMNGNVGKVNGVTFIVSNSVTASYALVVVPKRCATWKALSPLQTITKEDPLKSLTIRSAEMGVTQLTDPKACVLIINTQQE